MLVIEDNEPAAKWLSLVNQSLNKPFGVAPRRTNTGGGSLFFAKPSLRKISKTFRTESKKRLKSCNCTAEFERKHNKDFCCPLQQSNLSEVDFSSEEDDEDTLSNSFSNRSHMKYGLVASKQMVGIFVTIWMRTELIQYVSHLRICCISRGIMGCLGNKVLLKFYGDINWFYSFHSHRKITFEVCVVWLQGCISVSFQFHQTSFCFVCSHLASGEKEGDELRRNLDVIEILKNTQFPKICRLPSGRIPEKILDHEWVSLYWFNK